MNTCTIYLCDIKYDAYSLYKTLNYRGTTVSQAEQTQDEFDSLPQNVTVVINAMTDWNTDKKVLADWSLPYMLRDEIYQQTGWKPVSFDIVAMNVNGKFMEYPQDLTYEFKPKTRDQYKTNTHEEDEVINHNKDSEEIIE